MRHAGFDETTTDLTHRDTTGLRGMTETWMDSGIFSEAGILGGGGKALCEILTATGAMPLPMVDPRAGYGWRYDTRYR